MTQYLTEQNITLIVGAIVALCSLLSAVLQLAGKTTASKFVGGLPTAIDLGGIMRWIARGKVKLPIDTAGAIVLLACSSLLLPLCSGCQFWRDNKSEILADAEKWCVIALTATPEVKAEAAVRKLTGNQWATLLCQLPDIVEPFLIDAAEVATPKAIGSAKAKGLVK